MPNEYHDVIRTNQLIAQDIPSLNIIRNQNIDIILENRNNFIDEIKQFVESEDIILKIFGCDGIGKSLTFLYLTLLKNNFKVVYFNLKEINQKYANKLNIIEYQLLSYFSANLNGNESEKQKEKFSSYCFENYQKKIKLLEQQILSKNNEELDFWEILEYLIESNDNNLIKVVYIIDQYKYSNDKLNRIEKIKRKILEKNISVKLIISSSLNDLEVKFDFMGILKNFEDNKESNLYQKEKENDNLIETDIQIEKLFDDYISDNDYIDDMTEKDKKDFDDYFPKIKMFKRKEIFKKNEENPNQISLYKIITIEDRTKVKYINNLISIKNIQDENTNLIQILEDFDYNPKYYNKFKNYYYSFNNGSLEEIYSKFLHYVDEHISDKIEEFYRKYCLKVDSNMKPDQFMVCKLVLLYSIVEDKESINFSELIRLIESFPLKYIKIIPKKIIESKCNIIDINSDLSKKDFNLEYSFPFIRSIIYKLIYDKGNHGCLRFINENNGLGVFLESQIKKSIIIDRKLGEFEYRAFWTFEKSNNSKQKINIVNIDVFNLKRINLDDLNKDNKQLIITNYYISPEKPNNKLLDSVILIPVTTEKNAFILISFQITIQKRKIYSLSDYHKATSIASERIEKVYGIKIKKKYFMFVLAKDYENKKTQDKLNLKYIPFIFFSTIEKSFYINDTVKIFDIKPLINDRYRVEDKDYFREQESFGNKHSKLIYLNTLLNKKREKDNKNISKNLYYYARNKILQENCFQLPQKEKEEIITKILQKNIENITIEYAFRIHFSSIYELDCIDNYIGILFYKKICFVYYKYSLRILCSSNDVTEQFKLSIFYELSQRIALTRVNKYIFSIKKSVKMSTFNELIKEIKNEPSDIFLFYIYEMNSQI